MGKREYLGLATIFLVIAGYLSFASLHGFGLAHGAANHMAGQGAESSLDVAGIIKGLLL